MSSLTYFSFYVNILYQSKGEIKVTNADFSNMHYDYYNNTPSYVKEIIDLLSEEVSDTEKMIIPAIYNYILNNVQIEKKREVITVSRMFADKMEFTSCEEIADQARYIYRNFLKKMVFDMTNRERFFVIMNECIKVYVEYYSEKELLTSTANGIVKTTGNYR